MPLKAVDNWPDYPSLKRHVDALMQTYYYGMIMVIGRQLSEDLERFINLIHELDALDFTGSLNPNNSGCCSAGEIRDQRTPGKGHETVR